MINQDLGRQGGKSRFEAHDRKVPLLVRDCGNQRVAIPALCTFGNPIGLAAVHRRELRRDKTPK
jgi:hypothetical protein